MRTPAKLVRDMVRKKSADIQDGRSRQFIEECVAEAQRKAVSNPPTFDDICASAPPPIRKTIENPRCIHGVIQYSVVCLKCNPGPMSEPKQDELVAEIAKATCFYCRIGAAKASSKAHNHKGFIYECTDKSGTILPIVASRIAQARLEEAKKWKPIECVARSHHPLRNPICGMCQKMARWEERIADLERQLAEHVREEPK